MKKKDRRALVFRVSIEVVNLLFDYLKRRHFKLVPKDAHIYSIRREIESWDTYRVIVTSKEFPIVEEGQICRSGFPDVDVVKGIIELKEEGS